MRGGGPGTVFNYLKIGERKNVGVSATSPIGTFRGIDDGQMDGETEGQVSRKCGRGTYKPTDKQTLPSTNKPEGSTDQKIEKITYW